MIGVCVCVVDVHMLRVDQTVLSSWRSLHRMVQPMASSCIKMDLFISSKCVLSFSLRTEDPSRDVNEEREDGVGDTGAAINGCVLGKHTGGASFLRGAIL